MTDVQQATSQVVTEPTVLNDEALRPVNPLDILKGGLENNANTTTTTQRRGRGRPPGRKNNATLAREAAERTTGEGARVVVPNIRRTGQNPQDDKEQPDPAEVRAKKEARANEWTERISEEFNDNILLALISMGVPPSLLYKKGHEPSFVTENGKYTPLGAKIVLNPQQIKHYAKFITELEGTSIGTKFMSSSGSGKAGLYLEGLLSLGATVQYLQGVKEAWASLGPMLQVYRAAMLQQQQEDIKQKEQQASEANNAY